MGDGFDAPRVRVATSLQKILDSLEEPGRELDQAIDRATRAAIQIHRKAKNAQRRLEKAEKGGLSRMQWVAKNHDGPWQVLALLDLAIQARTTDPRRSLEWAELAVEAAERLEGPGTCSLRARAWAEKGNAERILERFREARRSLDRAVALLEAAGGGELTFRGEVFSLLASLEHALHRPEEALAALDKAKAGPRSCRLPHLHYSLLLKRANVLAYVGDFEAALEVLADAGLPPLIQSEQDMIATWHNSLWILTEIALCASDDQEREESVALVYRSFPDLVHLYERNQNWSDRRNWLFGRLAFVEGHMELSRRLLEDAASSLTELGEMTTAALVFLDLCLVLARMGRIDTLRQVAGSACQIFQATGLSQSRWAAHQLLLTCERKAIEDVIIEGLVSTGGASVRRRTPK